jgi:tRNA G18 (ribose-2'-O)-methylase SpoU
VPLDLRGGDVRRIPMMPGQESLNGATAMAIALYAWRRELDSRRVSSN